jgi:hypothetical protein
VNPTRPLPRLSVDLVGSVPVEKSFVRHGWTLIGHAGGDLLYVEKKSIRRFPNESKKYQLLRRHRGERGEARPQCRSGIFYFFVICRPSRKFAHWRVDAWVEFPRFPNSQGFCEVRKRGSPETESLPVTARFWRLGSWGCRKSRRFAFPASETQRRAYIIADNKLALNLTSPIRPAVPRFSLAK